MACVGLGGNCDKAAIDNFVRKKQMDKSTITYINIYSYQYTEDFASQNASVIDS